MNIGNHTTFSFPNGLAGERGRLEVCYEGEFVDICSESSVNFDADNAISTLCQKRGYSCKLEQKIMLIFIFIQLVILLNTILNTQLVTVDFILLILNVRLNHIITYMDVILLKVLVLRILLVFYAYEVCLT